MPAELRPLLRLLSLRREPSPDPVLHRGTSGQIEIVATSTGIGVRRAARVTEQLLDSVPVDHLMVVGIAGGIGASVEIGTLVVPELVIDLASGAEHRPALLGDFVQRGTLVTSDGLVVDPETFARLDRRGVVAIDMETAAIAEVCARRGCPFSAFRAISDHADDGSIDAAVFGLTRADGSPDLPAVARFLVTRPWRIPQLARLARGLSRATKVAAAAAVQSLQPV